MSEDQIIAILKTLVDLKVENMALWKILSGANLVPLNWPPPEIGEAEQAVAALRAAVATLPASGMSQIPTLLGTLSRTRLV
jgi:hypothetical protein